MSFSTRSSGDAIADRRYAYGDSAFQDGDHAAARDLFEQVIELAPGWPPAHFVLAKACIELGDADAAKAALNVVLALDRADRLGAGVLLARITGEAATGAAMPDAYVAGLFDEYAPRFDAHLVAALDYRAPELLVERLGASGGIAASRVLDLGCGTGLMAKALSGALAVPVAFTGVDLSEKMIGIARETGLYARLECAGLLAFLAREAHAAYDLVLAADVFCYVPDLAPVFTEVARVLEAGGRFAFTIQSHAGVGVVIGDDSRVHHAPSLVRALAAGAGLAIADEVEASTRQDRGKPVPGALFVLAKP